MPEEKGLRKIFVEEVRDCYDAERQLVKALPKMAKAASSSKLAQAFSAHLDETRGHVTKLEQVFASLDLKPRGKRCDGMAGIIEEAKNLLDEELDEATMDAGLIAAGQRAEHYEMAAYGALVAWAKAMGQVEAAGILEEILEQEKAADKKLSSLAESGINKRAARNGSQDEEGIGEQDDDTAQAPVPNIATQAGRRRQLAQRGSLGQGNAPGRPASQLGKQVPANESVKRLQRQPGRTGSRRADR